MTGAPFAPVAGFAGAEALGAVDGTTRALEEVTTEEAPTGFATVWDSRSVAAGRAVTEMPVAEATADGVAETSVGAIALDAEPLVAEPAGPRRAAK